ncbi:hypothetical protein HY256_06425, partial [Candidatus Sumerlaeota bacterium]|nr:hypothetical protein [Candidatus Sumerlaeota bacterium]
GGALGWAQGSYCKRNADRLIQQITDDIALAMKLWIEREGERLGLHDLR